MGKPHPSARTDAEIVVSNRTEALEGLLEIAQEVWTPCDSDPRWCSHHFEKPPCSMATLGYVLTDLDGEVRTQPWDAPDACDVCWHPLDDHIAYATGGRRCSTCGHILP